MVLGREPGDVPDLAEHDRRDHGPDTANLDDAGLGVRHDDLDLVANVLEPLVDRDQVRQLVGGQRLADLADLVPRSDAGSSPGEGRVRSPVSVPASDIALIVFEVATLPVSKSGLMFKEATAIATPMVGAPNPVTCWTEFPAPSVPADKSTRGRRSVT